ncbi:uncharacterized protein LOC128670046 [Plodia interpunctella]|uniref:uncharacterized protein LOC128670046 n=1 Tax=Plodia interpunctella TaxID=58824 RepID=UPI00236862C6|nr:uncharacterized protein LOC128670046 [Plodia interpunctella]
MNCIRLFKSIQRSQYSFLQTAKYAINFNHPIKFSETEDRWKEKDNVSNKWQLIYKGPMEPSLKFLSAYITFSTVTIGCSAIYYAAFQFDVATMNDPVVLGEDVVIANSAVECLVYLGAFIIFHTAIKILLSKYVVRLYRDGDNYLAIFRGHFFNSIKKHHFHLNDFRKLSPTFVVSWGDARFGLGKKHSILLENYFKTPNDFNYLLNKKNADSPESEVKI